MAVSVASASHVDLATVVADGMVSVTTLCCKLITVDLGVEWLREGDSHLSAIALTFSHRPSSSVVVAFGTDEQPSLLSIYPSEIVVYGDVRSLSSVGDLVALAYGNSSIVTTVTGASKDEYSLVINSPMDVAIASSQEPPPVPKVSSVIFANDAGSIVLSFDSETNRGATGTEFTCDNLLLFDGSGSSRCQWINYKLIAIYPSAGVVVGNRVVIQAGVIKAKCTLSTTPCSEWQTVVPDSTSVSGVIQAPLEPVSPTISLSYARTVGSCDGLVIDVSASAGAGGRAWQRPTFDVETTPAGVNTTGLIFFLNDEFVISPPSRISADLLVAGTDYIITVTMCNFLQGCGSSAAFVTVASIASVPIVSLLGSPTRSISTRDGLLVSARAYTAQCNGAVSTADLSFTWTIYQYGTYEVTTFTSESADPKKFKLSSYRLEPGTWYTVRVRAVHTDASSGTTSEAFASSTVSVPRGSLVSVLSGGSARSVRLGASLALTGADSFDQDIEDKFGFQLDDYGVSFTWSCVQLLPVYSVTCPINVTPLPTDQSRATADASNTTLAGVGTKARITLTLADDSRSGSSSLTLVVIEAESPLVSVSSVVSPTNPTKSLILSGVVSSSTVPCTTGWNVSDETVALASIALNAVSITVPAFAANYPVNLALSADSLSAQTSYQFTLSCGKGVAVVDFTTNGAPQYGDFSVMPASGIELSTIFSFRTENWYDAHTPITYQFEYFTSAGLVSVIQSRSELAYGSAMLPAGTGTDSNVTCRVSVFDALDAVVKSSHQVTVLAAASQSVADLASLVDSQIASAAGDNDATRQTISLFASVLNTVNCTLAPNCTDIGRNSCASSTASHTCGSCLSGLIGDQGSANTECLSASALTALQSNTSNFVNKQCDADCNGHGNCTWVNSATLQTVDSCLSNAQSCHAKCSCFDGFGGTLCGMTSSDLAASQEVFASLLTNLETLTTQEDSNAETVASWVSGVALLSQSPDSISAAGAESVLSISSAAMASAEGAGSSTESLLDLLGAVDSASTVLSNSGGENGMQVASGIISSLGSMVMQSMVLGQAPEVSSSGSTSMSSQVSSVGTDGSVNISVPQSGLEVAYQVPATSIAVQVGNSSQLSMATTVAEASAFQYGSAGANFSSNPLIVQMAVGNGLNTTVVVTYQNVAPMAYVSFNGTGDAAANVSTTCLTGETNVTTHYCPGDIAITHACNGTESVLVTPCPSVEVAPSCLTLGAVDGNEHCVVTEFTATTTTCSCVISDSSARRRRLSTGESVRSIQAVTIVESILGDFETTTSSIPTGEKGIIRVLKGSIIVLCLFAVFWAVGLLMMVYFLSDVSPWLKTERKGKYQDALQAAEHDLQTTSIQESLTGLREYMQMLMPVVYSVEIPMGERIRLEMLRSHKFCRILSPVRSEAERRDQLLNSFHILTTETMFLFTIAMCYDVDSPSDDGSCVTYTDRSSCLSQKSATDHKKAYCSWDADADTCSFVDPEFSWETTILVSIIVAVFVTIMDIPVNYLFDLMASPTTTASNEVKHVLAVGARRASVAATNVVQAARRASTVSASIVHNMTSVLPSTDNATPVPTHSQTQRPARLLPPPSARKFVFVTEASTYMLSDDVTKKRRSLMAGQTGVSLVSTAAGQLQQSCAPAATVAQYILNSDFIKRQAKQRQTLLSRRHPGDLIRPVCIDGETMELSPEQTQILTDMTLQVEKLSLESIRACFKFMKEWNYTVVLPEQQLIEIGSSSGSGGATSMPAGGLQTLLHALSIATEQYAENYESNIDILEREMIEVRDISKEKAEMLIYSGGAIVGMSILHEFILDVIGRQTSYGKIFARKAEVDFRRMYVVSFGTKILAGSLVMCVNLFCLMYAVLKGYSRGLKWQEQFLFACLLQLLAEIFVFETLEVLWNNVVVPQFAVEQVNAAYNIVLETINKFGEDARYYNDSFNSSQQEDIDVFNAADYFFISKQLAKAYPDNIESKLSVDMSLCTLLRPYLTSYTRWSWPMRLIWMTLRPLKTGWIGYLESHFSLNISPLRFCYLLSVCRQTCHAVCKTSL